jgi:hypothetical protein
VLWVEPKNLISFGITEASGKIGIAVGGIFKLSKIYTNLLRLVQCASILDVIVLVFVVRGEKMRCRTSGRVP